MGKPPSSHNQDNDNGGLKAPSLNIPGPRSSPPSINFSASNASLASFSYKLYKRRFAGLFGLFALNVVAALSLSWFGPISVKTSEEFDISITKVNWLGNIISCVYLPTTIAVPWIVSTYGLRRCCDIGSACMLLSAWLRHAGTARTLSSSGAYTLLIIAQFFSAIPQAIFQVLAPKYSEVWFNLQGRTTATMIIAVANPIGTALGQLISPFSGTTRQSILVLAIISTAVLPCVFLISDKPPKPPTHAAAQKTRSFKSLLLDLIGIQKKPNLDEDDGGVLMTPQKRLDFFLIMSSFGIYYALLMSFTILSAQDLSPYGYSDTTTGLMGATLLLSGIVAAGITAPLIDRVFTKHLAIMSKVLTPIMTAAWFSLIWAVRPHNTAGLFVIFGVIGSCSVTLLPIALELAVELTRAADASSALLWFAGNVFAVIFVTSEPTLRAGPTGSPPFNMRKAFIFQTAFVCVAMLLIFPLKGEQSRRTEDERDLVEQWNASQIAVAAERGENVEQSDEVSETREGSPNEMLNEKVAARGEPSGSQKVPV